MAVTDNLHKLTEKAQEAEQKAADAGKQARADLEASVQKSQTSVKASAARLQEQTKASEGKVSSWWGEQQQAWNAHVAKMRQSMDEYKVRHDARVAETQAEEAEGDASLAINFAYGAIEMAEYAVLNAILAREDADAAKTVAAGHSG